MKKKAKKKAVSSKTKIERVQVRVTLAEVKALKALAAKDVHCKGNLSKWLLTAGLKCVPTKK